MTKKHFIALADSIIRHNKFSPEDKFNEHQLRTLAEFCRTLNPNFKYERWMDYIAGNCGKNGGAVK